MTLVDVPPELFPVFASHLPVHATPPTLLSLALVNRRISGIVLPLIHSCIVLRYTDDAAKMIQRLLADPALGLAVRELYIMWGSPEPRNRWHIPSNIMTGLQDAIDQGLLPYIQSLGLVMLGDDKLQHHEHGFFRNLRSKCPRLMGLMLDDVGGTWGDCWLDETGLDEINDLSSLDLMLPMEYMEDEESLHSLQNYLGSLSRTLHTLSLSKEVDLIHASHFFCLDFPLLRSLSLSRCCVRDTREAMKFWNRHPLLEFIQCTTEDQNFFSDTFSFDFLPNLRHLKAEISDVLVLAPILHRLASLEIYHSYNAQIPYLLEALLPGGLPKLKSLYIDQRPCSPHADWGLSKNMEGLRYETEEYMSGHFELETEDMSIFDGYMPSIARGAPNLEELAMHGSSNEFLSLSSFRAIGSSLRPLSRLQRVYLTAPTIEDDIFLQGSRMRPSSRPLRVYLTAPDIEDGIFLQGSRILAESCKSLEVVTNTGTSTWPHINARIRRNSTGEVEDIVRGRGFGMQIGSEDQAFPV